ELDRLGGDALGVLEHPGVFRDLPAAHLGDRREGARPHHVVLAGGHREARVGLPRLLLDVGAFARREVLPLVGDVDRDVDVLHVLVLDHRVDDLLHEVLLRLPRDRVGILLDRRRPVDLVGRHGRETDVGLLGDGARPGDFGADPRNAADLVLGDDRAAGDPPGAAVNHAHAEAGRAGASRRAASAAPATPAEAAAPAAAASAAAAETAALVLLSRDRIAAVGIHAAARRAREADVGVAAARR